MSGECEICAEHCLECKCKHSIMESLCKHKCGCIPSGNEYFCIYCFHNFNETDSFNYFEEIPLCPLCHSKEEKFVHYIPYEITKEMQEAGFIFRPTFKNSKKDPKIWTDAYIYDFSD